jgi:membrane fusion protein, multidrug efflux system
MNRQRKRLWRVSLLTLVLAASPRIDMAAQELTTSSEERELNVRTLELRAKPLEEYLRLSGTATPLRAAVLSAEEGGVVRSVDLDKGSRVDKGQALLSLDRRLLAAELSAARAALDLAAFNEGRIKQLYESKAVSAADYERVKAEFRQAEAAVRGAELRHERAVVSAPFDGIVTDRYVEPGELLVPGTPVLRLLDPYVLKVKCNVTEENVVLLSRDMAAMVEFAGTNEPLPGRIHWVGFEADPMTGKFPVEILVENGQLALRPGVMGRARVVKARHEGVISIPRDAIIERPGGPAAFVVEDGRAVERPLVLGPDQGLLVAVRQGLSEGDKLIVRGQRELNPGMAVKVTEESRASDGSLPGDPVLRVRGGGRR